MSGITRRMLMAGAAGLGAAMAMPRWLHASMQIGDWQLDTLSDGNLMLPADFILGPMPADEVAPILARNGIAPGEPLTPPCNVTLLRGQGRVVLFDAGSGLAFQPSVGELPDALFALGVDPADVTDVVFTHAHPDHLWGALDDFDEAMFYNARHYMGAGELAYWRDPETMNSIGAARQAFAIGAARRLEMLGDMVESFDDGNEVLPGVTAVLTPGHTPGHMSFAVGNAMILGDAIGNHHVGFEAPGLLSGSDQDQTMAAETRLTLLDRIVADDLTVVGFHLPGGGIGRAERMDGAYRFVQDG
ncbi:MBL fold metallo-hydrolase [Nioella sp. MMSF_3534]|uniref:MBL fold metallo-hydrolase n=1 Tax=Nioella sp. MMSF_3534 TaxID=3046720 RepID=UPI00273E67F9|nr:MBL fold metallo-hydrolase [Nioella sp. MMSF_3534]